MSHLRLFLGLQMFKLAQPAAFGVAAVIAGGLALATPSAAAEAPAAAVRDAPAMRLALKPESLPQRPAAAVTQARGQARAAPVQYPTRDPALPAAGYEMVQLHGAFELATTKKEKLRDRLGAARYKLAEYTNPRDDSNGAANQAITARNQAAQATTETLKVFESARDLVIRRITVRTADLPASAYPHLQGDHCLFLKTEGKESEVAAATMCTATGIWGDTSYQRTLEFPDRLGLYMPKGTRLGCAVHIIAPANLKKPMDPALAAKTKVSCVIEYRAVEPESAVHKLVRIPYLDQMRQAPDLIPPDRPWYGTWSKSEGLVVRGLTAYYGPKGPGADEFGGKDICVYAVRKDGTPVAGKEICFPPQQYRAGHTDVSFKPAFVAGGFKVEPGEFLSGRCRLARGRPRADCVLYPLIEVPAKHRQGIGAGPLLSSAGYVNHDYLRDGYCKRDVDFVGELTFAGKRALDFQASSQPKSANGGEQGSVGRQAACERLFGEPPASGR